MSTRLDEPAAKTGPADLLSPLRAAMHSGGESAVRVNRRWVWLASAAALLAAAGSLVGLLAADLIYGQETEESE